jgi:hypothetical protein
MLTNGEEKKTKISNTSTYHNAENGQQAYCLLVSVWFFVSCLFWLRMSYGYELGGDHTMASRHDGKPGAPVRMG